MREYTCLRKVLPMLWVGEGMGGGILGRKLNWEWGGTPGTWSRERLSHGCEWTEVMEPMGKVIEDFP